MSCTFAKQIAAFAYEASCNPEPFFREGNAHVLHHFKPDRPRQDNKPDLEQGSEYGHEDGKRAETIVCTMTSSIIINVINDHHVIMMQSHRHVIEEKDGPDDGYSPSHSMGKNL